MTKILGKDVSISIVTSGSPQEIELIGCATETSIVTNADIAPSSTAGSGIFKEFTGISINWAGTITGFTTVGQNMDMQTLTGLQFKLQPVIISFKEVGPVGDIYYSGYAFITSISRTGNFNNAETYQVGFQGTGELLIDAIAVYGTFPEDITAVLVSGPALLIAWTDVPYPVPSSYIVSITDLDTNEETLYDNEVSGDTYPITTGDRYEIRVQSDYGSQGKSLFSPAIFYP